MDTSRGSLSGALLDGRYQMGGVIARGGMSTVYRGTDTRLGRAVAVKVMSPQYVTDQSFLVRFEREARIAAGLGHPGVVAVYDYGRDGDHVFLVMELVDGGTLRDLLRAAGPLSVPVTLSILEPLLAALGTAHAAGLVHRDIKPENVLISAKGEVKIADFGLVRAVSSQTMATGDVILGTVAYLSPEQVSTGAADPRSDVYAAGIVAWEMLTGRPPYSGDNAMAVAFQHVHSDIPSVATLAPGVPVALEDLITAATRREPPSRPRDAAAFLSAIVGVRARLGLSRVPVPVPSPRRSDRPGNTQSHTRATADPLPTSARPTEGAVAGPGGTRVLPAGRSPDEHPSAGRAETVRTAPPSARTAALLERRRRRIRRLIVLGIVLILAAAAAIGGWWLGSGRWAYAPTTVGLTQELAVDQVRSAGLVPAVSESSDDSVVAGTVASARPQAGTRLLRGSSVALVISTGLPVVPQISPGTSIADATAAMRAARLIVADQQRSDYHPTVRVGTLIGTDPVGGQRVRIGSAVTFDVSKGAQPVPVPVVTGKSVEDARNKLIVDGLVPGASRRVFNAVQDPGTVLESDPAAGQLLAPGSTVNLLVASSLVVPDVGGRTLADALAALTAGGFAPTEGTAVFSADVDGGHVTGTDPPIGSRVDPADPAVTVMTSTAVTVPYFGNVTITDARATASGLGLSISVATWLTTDSSVIYAQQPGPGTRVEPGSMITVGAL